MNPQELLPDDAGYWLIARLAGLRAGAIIIDDYG